MLKLNRCIYIKNVGCSIHVEKYLSEITKLSGNAL